MTGNIETAAVTLAGAALKIMRAWLMAKGNPNGAANALTGEQK